MIENFEWIKISLTLISLISLIFNIIQYIRKKEVKQNLLYLTKSQFNSHFLIARACARINYYKFKTLEDKIAFTDPEVRYIAGVTDQARTNIITTSQTYLKTTPKFFHPTSGEPEEDVSVMMGKRPDEKAWCEKENNIDVKIKNTQDTK